MTAQQWPRVSSSAVMPVMIDLNRPVVASVVPCVLGKRRHGHVSNVAAAARVAEGVEP